MISLSLDICLVVSDVLLLLAGIGGSILSSCTLAGIGGGILSSCTLAGIGGGILSSCTLDDGGCCSVETPKSSTLTFSELLVYFID